MRGTDGTTVHSWPLQQIGAKKIVAFVNSTREHHHYWPDEEGSVS
jgi:hypothetical protein